MATYIIPSGVTSEGIILNNGDTLEIQNGGFAVNTTVSSGGRMIIYDGGSASGVTADGSGYVVVSSGGKMIDAYLAGGGCEEQVIIEEGGVLSNARLVQGLNLVVRGSGYNLDFSEGTGDYTDLFLQGNGYVENASFGDNSNLSMQGGTRINGLTIYGSNILINVPSDAKIENLRKTPFTNNYYYDQIPAEAIISYDTADNTGVFYGFGGNLVSSAASIESFALESGYSMFVMSGGTINDVSVVSGASLEVAIGGVATGVVVEKGGKLSFTVAPDTYVQGTSDGKAFEMKDSVLEGYTVGADNSLLVADGVASETVVKGGRMQVYSSGVANNAVVNKGEMRVFSGGVVNGMTFNTGDVSIESGGIVNDAIVNADGMQVNSGATANNTIVNNGCFYVYSGTLNGGSFCAGNNTHAYGKVYGGTLNNVVVDGGELKINENSDGTKSVANGTIVNAGGDFRVYGGGTVNRTIVNEGGTLTAKRGGVASNTIVNNGNLTIQNECTANTVVLLGGSLYVEAGGSALNILNPGNNVYINIADGAEVTYLSPTGVYYLDEEGNLTSTTEMSAMTVGSACWMFVFPEGSVQDISVVKGGNLQIFDGGLADGVTVNADASFAVVSGATASNIKENGGWVDVEDGATVSFAAQVLAGLTLGEGQSATIHAGTVVGDAVINSGGRLHLFEGGAANGVTVSSGGVFHVSSGGTATNVDWIPFNGAIVEADAGASISFTDQCKGVFYGYGDQLIASALTMDSQTVEAGKQLIVVVSGAADNAVVEGGGEMRVSAGGVANTATVKADGWFHVTGGEANDTVVSGSIEYIDWDDWMETRVSRANMSVSGGVANNTGLVLGNMTVGDGGVLNGVVVSGVKADYNGWSGCERSYLTVSSGGVVNDAIDTWGEIRVGNGGVANRTVVSGFWGNDGFGDWGYLTVYSGGVMNDTVLKDGGSAVVSRGGTANRTVLSGGQLFVSSGVANETILNGGEMYVSKAGVVNSAILNGGNLHINSGAQANSAVLNGGNLYINGGGQVTSIAVNNGGNLHINSGALVNSTTLLYGNMTVSGGARVNDIELSGFGSSAGTVSNGFLNIAGNGTVDGVTVKAGGSMTVARGAEVLNIREDGGYVMVEDGATVSFLENTISGLVVKAYLDATVHSNTTALDTTVDGGWFFIRGGTASNTTLLNGSMWVSSGLADTVSINSNCVLYVSNGGTADAVTVLQGGLLNISSGGTADAVTVLQGARMTISGGGSADAVTVSQGAQLNISNGAIATGILENGGWVNVANGATVSFQANVLSGLVLENYQSATAHSGTTATGTTVGAYGNLSVTGGTAEHTAVQGTMGDEWWDMRRAYMTITQSGIASDTLVEYGEMTIANGGAANGVIVRAGGSLTVLDGVADNAVVSGGSEWYDSGNLYVSSGGTANSVSIGNNARVYVYDSGTVTGAVFGNGGEMSVSSGGTVTDATVNSGGRIIVSRAGVANSMAVNDGGQLFVAKGGSAAEILEDGGWVEIEDGADVTFVQNTFSGLVMAEGHSATVNSRVALQTTLSGGMLSVRKGGVASETVIKRGELRVDGGLVSETTIIGDYLNVNNGGVASKTTVKGGNLTVNDGGVALETTVARGGGLNVQNGGVARNTLVQDNLNVWEGGTAVNTTIDDGYINLYYGGVASNTIIKSGSLYVNNGCTADTVILVGGDLHVEAVGSALNILRPGNKGNVYLNSDEAVATYLPETGVYYLDEEGQLSSATEMSGITIGSACWMFVFSEGNVQNITVADGGNFMMFEGGSADGITVSADASFSVVSGAIALNIKENGGWVEIADGATVSFAEQTFSGLTLNERQSATVHAGTVASDTVINSGGKLQVYDGGAANGVTLNKDGSFGISSGGQADGVTVNADASFAVVNGATALNIKENGGWVDVQAGATATFAEQILTGLTLGEGRSATVHAGTVASDTVINSGGRLHLFDGGAANGVTVSSGGVFHVSSGGTATNVDWTPFNGANVEVDDGASVTFTDQFKGVFYGYGNTLISSALVMDSQTVEAGKQLIVVVSGTADNAVVEGGGEIRVSSGGVANNTAIYGGTNWYETGVVNVFTGGTVNSTTVNASAYLYVSGGEANDTVVSGSVEYIQWDGWTETRVNRANMTVSGGAANDTTVLEFGEMILSSGGVANNTTVSSGGSLGVRDGGIASGVTAQAGYVRVNSGGLMVDAYLSEGNGGEMVTVEQGGVLSGAQVVSGVDLYVYGSAYDIVLRDDKNGDLSDLFLREGAYAENVDVRAGGNLGLDKGATLNGAIINAGAQLDFRTWAGTGEIAFRNIVVNSGVQFGIDSDLKTDGITVNAGAIIYVYDNATATDIVENGGWVNVSDNASATFKENTLSGLVLGEYQSATVHKGTTATETVVTNNARLNIYSGGAADGVTVSRGGLLSIDRGVVTDVKVMNLASIEMTVDSGTNIAGTIGGSAFAVENGTIAGFEVAERKRLTLRDGGIANDAVVTSGGWFNVSSGGVANDAEVKEGGEFHIFDGGIVSNTTLNGGFMNIAGTAAGVAVSGGRLSIGFGATVTGLVLENDTTFDISMDDKTNVAGTRKDSEGNDIAFEIKDGRVDDFILKRDDVMCPFSGSLATNLTLTENASLNIVGGTVNGVATENFWGWYGIWVSDGILTGRISVTNGRIGIAYDGVLLFNVSDLTPDQDTTRITDYSCIQDTPILTATVSEAQIQGSYVLARNAGNFNGYITVSKAEDGTFLDELTVGHQFELAGKTYALNLKDSVLTLDVQTVGPVITLTADNKTSLQESVLTATSDPDVEIFFSTDNKEWKKYENALTVIENETYFFKGLDGAGNIGTNWISFDNIDRIPPEAPAVSANITELTNKDVKLTAVYSADSTKKEYSLDGGETWKNYLSTGVTLTENGTVLFRGTDAADNKSEVVSYVVDYIDKTPPATPTFVADITDPTNTDVIVTATFSEDSVVRQYRLNNGSWTDYTEPVTMTKNGTLSFRAKDAANNYSETAVCEVGNIDKAAPVITLTGDNRTPLQSATLTASTEDGLTIYVSTDNETWTEYTGEIAIPENITYYFKATDAANNTGTKSITFANIDTTPPEAPTVTANYTELTNQDVKLTAVFSADSIVKEYSLDGGETWKKYSSSVTLTENGTVLFRGTDAAGNESEIVIRTVDYIDKTPPATPTFVADITDPTNTDVVVTATFSEDSAVRQYRLNNGSWTDYTEPVTMTKNGTVSFRAKDAANNYSETAVCEVGNIDKVAPVITLNGDNRTPLQSATLTASTEDGLTIYVSTDNETWTEYTGEIAIPENITYYFKATDAANNTGTKSITFANIDSEAPVIAEATLTQGASNYVFNVKQNVTDNTVSASKLTYSVRYAESLDALASANPVSGLSFTLTESDAAKMFYYQTSAMDAAGNIAWTDAKEFTVADRTKPVLNGQPEATFADRAVTVAWDPASDNVGVAGYRLELNGETYDLREAGFRLEDVTYGDYTYRITAYDAAGNETSSERKTLTVEKRADLYLHSVRVRTKKQDVVSEATTTIAITDDADLWIEVGNMGDIDSTLSTAYVWCGDVYRAISVAPVTAGGVPQSFHISITDGLLSTGIQDIRVVLDAKNDVLEYDKSNNETSLTLNVENTMYGDLVIGSLHLDKTVCSPAEDVTLTFTVKNIGYKEIAASRAFLYDGENKIAEVDVASLAMGGETQDLTCVIKAGTLAAGEHALRIVANGAKSASSGAQGPTETSLDNNGAQIQLTVGFCDLSISRLTLSKDTCNTDENVIVSFTVRNSGTDKAAASVASIYDGDELLGSVEVDELAAGLSVSKQFTISAGSLPAGLHALRVVADDGHTVSEADESNNTRSAALQVMQKDDRAPEFQEIMIQQNADYTFKATAKAKDNITPAADIVYGIRYAETEEALESAEVLAGTTFSVSQEYAGKTLYCQVSATDLAGNTTWCLARELTVADRTAPEIGNVSVSTTDSILRLSWEATDNLGVAKYEVYFDGELVSTQETTTFRKEGVSNGTHKYAIVAYDAAGNTASTGDVRVVFDDTVAPVIDSVDAVQSADGYDIAFSVSASDNRTASADLVSRVRYAFTADGVEKAPLSGLSLTLGPEDAGKTLYYQVSAADEAGNTVWSEIQSLVIKDTTVPEIPADLSQTVNGSGVTLNWTASTDLGGVAGYRVRYGVSEEVSGDGIMVAKNSCELSALPEGVYYWQTAAVDAAGNVSDWSEVRSFRILPEDAFGAIGTADKAYELGALSGEQTLTGGAISSADDADWFKFTLNAKGTANDYIQIAFDNKAGDLDLYLYSANGTTLLASSDGATGDMEQISLKDLQKGTYLLKVAGKDGAMNTFSLSTKKLAGYDEDVYDATSRNDTMEAATVFDLEKTPQATVSGLNLDTANDVDYYQFTLTNMGLDGDSVSISFENSVGDLDLALFDSKGVKVAESAGTTNEETVSFSGLAAGSYYLKVATSNNSPNEYTLNWNVTSNKVKADVLEGKEPYSIGTSTEIKDLSISAVADGVTQEDTFRLVLNQAGSATSKIRFSNYRSDWNGLKYVVRDANNAVVLSGTGSEISLDGLDAGNYNLTVDTPVAGSFSSYDISVSLPDGAATKWTYMVYMASDNNLDSSALDDIVSMQQADLDSQIDIYILVDRSPVKTGIDLIASMVSSRFQWDSSWSDTRVGKITYSPGKKVAVEWETWGETDSSSPETLKQFVNWTQAQSKSENYALIMWDHGVENGTLCVDGTTDEDWGTSMTVSDVSSIVKENDISLVIFNNCMLGSELVAAQMSGSADVIVASEAESYSSSVTYGYKEFFSTITADMTAEEMAKVLVQNVRGFPGNAAPSMLAAVDVTDTSLATALENLAAAVAASGNANDKTVLINGLAKTLQDGCYYPGSSVYQSDLYDAIVQAMADRSYSKTSDGFKTAVAALKSTLEDVVLLSKTVPTNRGYGIATFNPVLTIKAFSTLGMNKKTVSEFIQTYVDTYYTSLPAWGALLADLATTYQSQSGSVTGKIASYSVSSIIDIGSDVLVASMDLGCFSGRGEVNSGISLFGDIYLGVTITSADKSSGRFVVTNDAGSPVAISILAAEDGSLVKSGTDSVSFSDLAEGDYLILLQSNDDCTVALTFDADWMTGVDRFDYAQGKVNEKFANGNGTLSKASSLSAGYHSGLLTYQGDTDWYQIGNVYTEKYKVELEGVEGMTVAEYDSEGKLVQTAKFADGIYSMTVQSMNYLFVEGVADLEKDEVNAYSVTVSGVQNGVDDVPPEAPVATADVTELTNGDVTVTAAFSEDSAVREYSLDGGKTWTAYKEAVKFTENGAVIFRATDAAGNISETPYEVKNIDKVAPEAPVLEVNVTDFTNGDVSITATFSEDTAVKEVSTDGGKTWKQYDEGGVIIIINSSVIFRATDAAGNSSEASYEVINIDKDAPAAPSGLLATVTDRKVALSWTASTDDLAGVKEYIVTYSHDGQEFTANTAETNFLLENADPATWQWSVKAVDNAGNVSEASAGDAFVVAEIVPEPVKEFVTKSSVDGNGISDVMFQYTGGFGQIGFWMNGTSEWKSTNATHPVDTWEVLGAYDMNANGKADSVLVGNVEVGGVKGAFVGYYVDAEDLDANWVNISYLTNNEGYVWKNKVGNLTGNKGMNSIVWHSTELGALGVWTDGTDSWVGLGAGYDANWEMVGCGDFTGSGKDTVLMSYANGQVFYTIGIDGAASELTKSDLGWVVRAIGDFSGDGKDDIVAFHAETGLVAMWGDGNSSNWSLLGQLDAKDWFVVGAGDYNGDKHDDLLVRQYSTGMLGYYANGDMSQWVELGRGVDMSWTVIA